MLLMKRLFYILLFLPLLILVSCSRDVYHPGQEPSRVLLAYIGTDNNLSGLEQAKLEGLRQGRTGRTNERIIAYVDNRRGNAKLYDLSGEAATEVIATYGKENSASADVLARVIRDVRTMYPADHYGLLVFSHASGWLPEGTLNNPYGGGEAFESDIVNWNETFLTTERAVSSRSIIIDGDREMDLRDFAAAIPDGMFDYIVFEACFMAGIEVAYELRRKAPYVLASSAEIVHPGFEPVYPSATPDLLAGNLERFGQSVFDHTLTYSETDVKRSATYSVIRTAGLDDLAGFIRRNCDFSKEVRVSDIQHFDRLKTHRLFFDFGDYYSRLLDTERQRSELAGLIRDCVVWKEATAEFMTQAKGYEGFTIDKHSGLTTYIPQTAFPYLNQAYGGLSWSRALSR